MFGEIKLNLDTVEEEPSKKQLIDEMVLKLELEELIASVETGYSVVDGNPLTESQKLALEARILEIETIIGPICDHVYSEKRKND